MAEAGLRWRCPVCDREIALPHFKRHLWKHDREGRGDETGPAWQRFVRESGYFTPNPNPPSTPPATGIERLRR